MPQEIRGYCPYGCRNADADHESQFDGNGYCKHLVGFITLSANEGAVGRLFEPLESIDLPLRDADGKPTGSTVPSGLLKVNGRNKQPILESDVVVKPRQLQKNLTVHDEDTEKVLFKPKLGISSRVFRKDGNTPVVIRPVENEPGARLREAISDKEAELAELRRQASDEDKRREAEDTPAETFGDESDGARNAETERRERKVARRQTQPA